MPSKSLKVSDVLSYLAKFGSAAAEDDEFVSEQRLGYREAAAVRVAMDDFEELQPVRGKPEPGAAARVLADDCLPATGRKLGGQLILAPEVRTETIRQLSTEGRLEEALAANPAKVETPLQLQYERYLRQAAPPLADQSLDDLELTHQVAVWIGDAVPGVPTTAEVAARANLLRLLAPFETLAGDAVFRGRQRELDILRSYIGVVSPETLRGRIGERFRWARPERQPAICIYGPGGVGKSALVARFMLEHTRLPENVRIPFGYLDFDRVLLDVGDPLGLILELLRQLELQFPDQHRFADLRQRATKQFAGGSAALDLADRIGPAAALFSEVLAGLRSALGPRPYVIVLDTFEQVQYRGESRATPLWSMLNELQRSAPFLRVLVAGRAPVESLRLAGDSPRELHLHELDVDSAVAFLAAQGIPDSVVAQRLVETFGRLPLSLKLIGSLALRLPGGASALLHDDAAGSALVDASDAFVQGYLYERILDHIDNEQIRRLAHPGLVLRRINPAIIRYVLNEPCGLGVQSLTEAQLLFEEFRREASLVTVDSADGDLVHRADIRRVMLALLVANAPAQVAEIRRAAIEWYAGQTGRRADAEEVYHRLHLGELIGSRRLTDSEVRASIQAAVEEFPLAVQLHLATMGFDVPKEVQDRASREQREAGLASDIEELLPYWPESEYEIRELSESLRRPRAGSPLFRTRARVAEQQGDDERALSLIERGLSGSAGTPATAVTLELLQERAWVLRSRPKGELSKALSTLGEHASRHQSRPALLQHRLQRLLAQGRPSVAELEEMAELLAQADSFDVWGLVPALGPLVAWARELDVPALSQSLSKVLRLGSSPFESAVFPDPRPQAALDELLTVEDGPDHGYFALAFGELCKVWPYRALFVSPPYGRRGEQFTLSEA